MDTKSLLVAEPLFVSLPSRHQVSRIFPCVSSISKSISEASRTFRISKNNRNSTPINIRRSTPTFIANNSFPSKSGVYTVGDFMTRKDQLKVVKPSTPLDEALEALVENRITGFPVVDDDWKLVGVVSDYDLLALDSISGTASADTSMFPEVDSSWKTFNELQRLLTKTNGRMVADVMTQAPVVVRETTNLEDAAKLLLETRYRRLPVVDSDGKLVGIITRGNVISAALQIKRDAEKEAH